MYKAKEMSNYVRSSKRAAFNYETLSRNSGTGNQGHHLNYLNSDQLLAMFTQKVTSTTVCQYTLIEQST